MPDTSYLANNFPPEEGHIVLGCGCFLVSHKRFQPEDYPRAWQGTTVALRRARSCARRPSCIFNATRERLALLEERRGAGGQVIAWRTVRYVARADLGTDQDAR